jgi:hypothetical protein
MTTPTPTPTATPMFSRSGRATVELRQQIAKETIDTLDAVSLARDMERYELVEEILGKWAAAKRHESMLVARITRGNGDSAEPHGGQKP